MPTTLHASASSNNNFQECLESASAATAAARHFWELRGTSAGEPQGDRSSDYEGSAWKHVAKEEDSFQVDLRIQEVSQDAVQKSQERMTKIQKTK